MVSQLPEGQREPPAFFFNEAEARPADQAHRIAVEVAATSEPSPRPVQALLPPAATRLLGLTVLDENQPARWLQDASDFR